jgi:hypothetical protein
MKEGEAKSNQFTYFKSGLATLEKEITNGEYEAKSVINSMELMLGK